MKSPYRLADSAAPVLHSRHEVICPHERQNVLLRRYLLRALAFWREEMAGLKHFNKLPSPMYPPPEIALAGGFSILA